MKWIWCGSQTLLLRNQLHRNRMFYCFFLVKKKNQKQTYPIDRFYVRIRYPNPDKLTKCWCANLGLIIHVVVGVLSLVVCCISNTSDEPVFRTYGGSKPELSPVVIVSTSTCKQTQLFVHPLLILNSEYVYIKLDLHLEK